MASGSGVGKGSGASNGGGKRGETTGAPSPQDVFTRISRATRQSSFQAQTVCPHCGGLKWGDGSVCPSCGDSGTVTATSIHPDSQWLAGDKDRVTADELAGAFARNEPRGGRIRALIQFPGLATRLDGEGKEALWQEVDRSPLALFGHAPDVIAEIGGVEHVAQAAQEHPIAARASLRALPAIREHHPRGDAIAREIEAGE